jgi:hypothetical protein
MICFPLGSLGGSRVNAPTLAFQAFSFSRACHRQIPYERIAHPRTGWTCAPIYGMRVFRQCADWYRRQVNMIRYRPGPSDQKLLFTNAQKPTYHRLDGGFAGGIRGGLIEGFFGAIPVFGAGAGPVLRVDAAAWLGDKTGWSVREASGVLLAAVPRCAAPLRSSTCKRRVSMNSLP